MLNKRKDEGSTEKTFCMTVLHGDPWPVFGFGFMVKGTFYFVYYICTFSCSVWMCIVTFFFIFRLTLIVEFLFTSLLVVFILRVVYML